MSVYSLIEDIIRLFGEKADCEIRVRVLVATVAC